MYGPKRNAGKYRRIINGEQIQTQNSCIQNKMLKISFIPNGSNRIDGMGHIRRPHY